MQIQTTYYRSLLPTLFLITTPIGNLKSISKIVKPTLNKLEFLLCEDTRHTKKLLAQLQITHLKLFSFHKFNEKQRVQQVLTWMRQNHNVGLVSCAGVPLIADPGFNLVETVISNNYYVTSIGLNNSGLAALITSGFPTNQFYFVNFLAVSQTKKTKLLTHLLPINTTLIFFEAVHRLKSTLQLFQKLWPDHHFSLARELTKKYETIYRGQFNMLKLNCITFKGEFVLVINNCELIDTSSQTLVNFVQTIADFPLTTKQKVQLGNKLLHLPKRQLLQQLLKIIDEKKTFY